MLHMNNTTLDDQDCYGEFFQNNAVLWSCILLLTLLIFFTLVGNAIVCLAFLIDKSLRTPANIFLLNMSFGDIIVTFTVILTDYSYLIFFPTWKLGSLGNWIYNIGFVALLIVPFLTVTAVTIDRYLCITYPLHYIVLVTKRRVVFCVLALWFYTTLAVTITVLFAFEKNVVNDYWQFLLLNPYYIIILLCHTLVPLTIVVVLYFRIYIVARRHRRQIDILDRRFRPQTRFMVSQLKTARTVFIVVIALMLSWLPFIINELLWYFLIPGRLQCVFLKVGAVVNYITYINGAMNPIVYALRHQRFFIVFKKIVSCNHVISRRRLVVSERRR